MGITKNIHLIFHDWGEPCPPLFMECEKRIRDMHPSWNIKMWDDEAGFEFVKEYLPAHLQAYKDFPQKVQRTDFLRLALVYVFGGFYMDLDILPIQPLDSLTDLSLVLAEEMTISEARQKALNLKYRIRIANYMFGGTSGHPFIRSVIDSMALRSSMAVTSQQEVLDITGPGLLTDTYWDNVDAYQDITLLRNQGQYYVMPDGRREPCLFGDYAVHLHTGTWRKGLSL